MSSPTNVLITINTHGGKDACARVAEQCQKEWRARTPQITGHYDYPPYYALTDQMIDAFYDRVVSGQAYSPGHEGDQLVFAYDGDYIDEEGTLLPEIAIFLRRLNETEGGGHYSRCATIIAAHEDSYCRAWKISDDYDYKPRRFGTLPFGFDKDVGEGEEVIGDDE